MKLSITQGRYPFLCPSPATAPEDVIPKVGSRLQGFKLKEIFFKNINKKTQNENQADMKSKLLEESHSYQ